LREEWYPGGARTCGPPYVPDETMEDRQTFQLPERKNSVLSLPGALPEYDPKALPAPRVSGLSLETEGNTISTFKKVLAFFGALFVIGAIITAGVGVTSAARGEAPAAAFAAAPIPPGTTATLDLPDRLGQVVMEAGGVTCLDAVVSDTAAITGTITLSDNTSLISASNIRGETLTVSGTSPDWTVTSKNGLNLGGKVRLCMEATVDGYIGEPYAEAGSTGTLKTSFDVLVYSPISPSGQLGRHGFTCWDFANDDPAAPTATLTVFDGTVATGASNFWGAGAGVAQTNDQVTVTSATGLGLGASVRVCLTSNNSALPYGAPK